jgi:hypothetical protein
MLFLPLQGCPFLPFLAGIMTKCFEVRLNSSLEYAGCLIKKCCSLSNGTFHNVAWVDDTLVNRGCVLGSSDGYAGTIIAPVHFFLLYLESQLFRSIVVLR